VPDDEVGFTAYFNRNYANQFPGPEQGEPEITHGDMTFNELVGLRVTIMHWRNITFPDPGMPDPWHITVRRGGQVIADTMTQTIPQTSGPQQQVDIPLYPQAGDTVDAVGPAGYRARSVTYDGLPTIDSCTPGSGVVTASFPPGAPSGSQLPDRIEHGHTQVPISGSGTITAPVPGGPSSSLIAKTSREVAPLVFISSETKVDTPYCGGLGPRDGYIDGGELDITRRGVEFIDPIRCSPYGAVACKVLIKATARRNGRRVAALARSTLTIAPGKTTAGRRLPYVNWIKRAVTSGRLKGSRDQRQGLRAAARADRHARDDRRLLHEAARVAAVLTG
jgi:hypothetical protein